MGTGHSNKLRRPLRSSDALSAFGSSCTGKDRSQLWYFWSHAICSFCCDSTSCRVAQTQHSNAWVFRCARSSHAAHTHRPVRHLDVPAPLLQGFILHLQHGTLFSRSLRGGRARWLCRNTPHSQNMIWVVQPHLVGRTDCAHDVTLLLLLFVELFLRPAQFLSGGTITTPRKGSQ